MVVCMTLLRMLKSPPNALTVWRSHYAPPRPANIVIRDVVVRYSDGPALMVSGNSTQISDCAFEWNDWTGVGGSWPLAVPTQGKAHRATTVWVDDNDLLALSRLSFSNNGAAQSINAGAHANVSVRVELCSFQSQLSLQDDGAFVEGGGTPSTFYQRNWGTSTGKAGLRWDGYFPGTLGGAMVENVVWNASALMIKGDQHNVTRNTVFDGADIASGHAMHDRPRYQDHTSPLDNLTIPSAHIGAGTKEFNPLANQKSVFTRNIFDAVAISGAHPEHNATIPGQWSGNMIGTDTPNGKGVAFDIKAELRNPYHMDFRPCPNSSAASLGVGAYPPWTPTDETYWIPGRRELAVASTPLPPHGAIGVHRNTDLMFLPAIMAISHAVYFGLAGSASPLDRVATLVGPLNNVARLPQHASAAAMGVVVADTDYAWRVDTVIAGGEVHTGTVWHFATGNQSSCAIAPNPPPRPGPGPAPMACPAAEEQYCPGDAHTGVQKLGKCYTCVCKFSRELEEAGCYTGAGNGGRHAFIETFCGPT